MLVHAILCNLLETHSCHHNQVDYQVDYPCKVCQCRTREERPWKTATAPQSIWNTAVITKLGQAKRPAKGVDLAINAERGFHPTFHGDSVSSHAIKVLRRVVVIPAHRFLNDLFALLRGEQPAFAWPMTFEGGINDDPSVTPESTLHQTSMAPGTQRFWFSELAGTLH